MKQSTLRFIGTLSLLMSSNFKVWLPSESPDIENNGKTVCRNSLSFGTVLGERTPSRYTSTFRLSSSRPQEPKTDTAVPNVSDVAE